jgi:hypothetical protein
MTAVQESCPIRSTAQDEGRAPLAIPLKAMQQPSAGDAQGMAPGSRGSQRAARRAGRPACRSRSLPRAFALQ